MNSSAGSLLPDVACQIGRHPPPPGKGFIREKVDTMWQKSFSFFGHLTYLVWVARCAKSVYIHNILIQGNTICTDCNATSNATSNAMVTVPVRLDHPVWTALPAFLVNVRLPYGCDCADFAPIVFDSEEPLDDNFLDGDFLDFFGS